MLSGKKYQRFLAFKRKQQAMRQARIAERATDGPGPASDPPPAPGDYHGGRRSPTPPARRRAILREAPEVRTYRPERPVGETARPRPGQAAATYRPERQGETTGGRSVSPSRHEGAAGPAAAKGSAKSAGKGKKGGGGKKGGKGGKGSKSRQG